jgi:DNA-binding XRE family transcriptional regulator
MELNVDAITVIGRDDVMKTSRGARMRGVAANGDYIKERRRSRGLTQEALATAAHCDIKTVYRAESGAHLDMATLSRLAHVLRVPYRSVVKASNDE